MICGRHARRAPVVLEAERLEHRRHVLPADVLEMERVAVDHLAAAQGEDLDDGAVAVGCEADHVGRAARLPLDRLPLDEVLHREQPVPVTGGVLESLVLRGGLHLLLELALDRLHLAGEELDHRLDDRAVVLLRDVADAGRETALDVVVETRYTRVPAGLRPLARPVREDAVEHVERLAHLLRVRVRAEVPDAGTVPLAREHHARVVVLHRDRDVRERLVVAQAHVERRPVPLDEVLLEMEGLHLAARDDDLDVGDTLGQLADLDPAVGRLLEVRAHARPQRLRLADVEHRAVGVAEQVDARLGRQGLELVLDTAVHGRVTVAEPYR